MFWLVDIKYQSAFLYLHPLLQTHLNISTPLAKRDHMLVFVGDSWAFVKAITNQCHWFNKNPALHPFGWNQHFHNQWLMSERKAVSMSNLEYQSKDSLHMALLSLLRWSFLCHLKFQLNVPGFPHFPLVLSKHKLDLQGNSFFGEHKHQQQCIIVCFHTTTCAYSDHQD